LRRQVANRLGTWHHWVHTCLASYHTLQWWRPSYSEMSCDYCYCSFNGRRFYK